MISVLNRRGAHWLALCYRPSPYVWPCTLVMVFGVIIHKVRKRAQWPNKILLKKKYLTCQKVGSSVHFEAI